MLEAPARQENFSRHWLDQILGFMLRAKSGLLHRLVDPAQFGAVVPRQMSEETPGETPHDHYLVVTFSALSGLHL